MPAYEWRTTRYIDAAIGRMLDQIQARLSLLRISQTAAHQGLDVIARYLDQVRQAVADRIIGYGLLVAEKPQGARAQSKRRTRTPRS
jgi:arsenite methyltransferase